MSNYAFCLIFNILYCFGHKILSGCVGSGSHPYA